MTLVNKIPRILTKELKEILKIFSQNQKWMKLLDKKKMNLMNTSSKLQRNLNKNKKMILIF